MIFRAILSDRLFDKKLAVNRP